MYTALLVDFPLSLLFLGFSLLFCFHDLLVHWLYHFIWTFLVFSFLFVFFLQCCHSDSDATWMMDTGEICVRCGICLGCLSHSNNLVFFKKKEEGRPQVRQVSDTYRLLLYLVVFFSEISKNVVVGFRIRTGRPIT